MAFRIPVDSHIEVVPAVVITGVVGVLVHGMHRCKPQVLPDTVRDLAETICRHELEGYSRKAAWERHIALVAPVQDIRAKVDEDLILHKAFDQVHDFSPPFSSSAIYRFRYHTAF